MSNLVELANELEDFPKEQLIQMSQDPNSTYPSYLVLSEIKRRTQMEKMYAAQQPKPETTVAEEVVSEFASSPAGLGAMAQSSDTPNAFQSGEMGNMAPPSPMQMMASGGLTGYQAGSTTEQEMLKNQFLQSAGISDSSAGIGSANPMQEQINREEVDKNIGQLAQQYGVSTLKYIGALNEDGSINYGKSALAIASLHPIVRYGKRAALGLGSAAQRFAPRLLQKAKNLVTKPGMKIQNPALKTGMQYGDDIIDPKTGAKIPKVITGPRTLKMPTVRGIGNLALPSLVISNLIEGGRERQDERELQAKLKAEQDKEAAKQLEADIAARQQAAADKEAELLAKAKESRQADMLIGLGGAIGSAKNLGELSSGISNAYFGVKSAEQASELKGLQGRLLEAKIANMEPQAIINEMNALTSYIKNAQDAGITIPEEEMKSINAQMTILREQLQILRDKTGTGFAASESPTGGDILSKNKVA